jgi:Domain of unknown function (DUF4190)
MTTPHYQGGYPQAAPARTNGLAIAALICSFFVSLVGVILGHIALHQIKTRGEGGRGLAIAALIIGYASMAISLVILLTSMGLVATQT